MSYGDIARIRQDAPLRDRICACVALEAPAESPETWALGMGWRLAAQPGWADAWRNAPKDQPDGYEIGADESVITDEMIRDAVTRLLQP